MVQRRECNISGFRLAGAHVAYTIGKLQQNALTTGDVSYIVLRQTNIHTNMQIGVAFLVLRHASKLGLLNSDLITKLPKCLSFTSLSKKRTYTSTTCKFKLITSFPFNFWLRNLILFTKWKLETQNNITKYLKKGVGYNSNSCPSLGILVAALSGYVHLSYEIIATFF